MTKAEIEEFNKEMKEWEEEMKANNEKNNWRTSWFSSNDTCLF